MIKIKFWGYIYNLYIYCIITYHQDLRDVFREPQKNYKSPNISYGIYHYIPAVHFQYFPSQFHLPTLTSYPEKSFKYQYIFRYNHTIIRWHILLMKFIAWFLKTVDYWIYYLNISYLVLFYNLCLTLKVFG